MFYQIRKHRAQRSRKLHPVRLRSPYLDRQRVTVYLNRVAGEVKGSEEQRYRGVAVSGSQVRIAGQISPKACHGESHPDERRHRRFKVCEDPVEKLIARELFGSDSDTTLEQVHPGVTARVSQCGGEVLA